MVENRVVEGVRLTKTEREVLVYLTADFLTVKEIAKKRKTSDKVIYKIRKKLLDYGIINKNNLFSNRNYKDYYIKVENGGYPIQPLNKNLRLHAEMFKILPINFQPQYLAKLKKGLFPVELDGNSLRFYQSCIIVWFNKDFVAPTTDQCDKQSLDYLVRFLRKLESRTGLVFLKDGLSNIIRCRAEYAEMGNELAKTVIERNEKILIRDENGELWALFDDSNKNKEAEAVHPKMSRDDMNDIIQPFFNDLRLNKNSVLFPSALTSAVMLQQENQVKLTDSVNEVAQGLNILIKLLTPKPMPEPKDYDSDLGDYFG